AHRSRSPWRSRKAKPSPTASRRACAEASSRRSARSAAPRCAPRGCRPTSSPNTPRWATSSKPPPTRRPASWHRKRERSQLSCFDGGEEDDQEGSEESAGEARGPRQDGCGEEERALGKEGRARRREGVAAPRGRRAAVHRR